MTEAIQKTMNTVMKAEQILAQFHQNVADLFWTLRAEFAKAETAFEPVGSEGELLLSSQEGKLQGASSWIVKHTAMPFCMSDEDDGPIVLAHVSIDKQFADEPEVWLGVFSDIESEEGEEHPWEDCVSYIFEDYFGPEDAWSESDTWYDDSFSDSVVSATIAFYRFPLSRLTDRDAIRTEIVERLVAYTDQD